MELEKDAVYLVNKPFGKTSFFVVYLIRKLLGKHFGSKLKVGHAGTLDPRATGLLIICTGKKTKEIDSFVGLDKSYSGEIYLGQTRIGYDAEGEIIEEKSIEHLSHSDILKEIPNFIGKIMQTPPIYSALKVDGERAYDLARKGIDVKMASREININAFEITSIIGPLVSFKVDCSKGTYIRSLAFDLGANLGVGAHLHSLVRTKIGSYKLEDAWDFEELVTFIRSKGNKNVSS
ncbi:MAG: tRNA pseudouridine(55) synthase TruB [Bacteroidetes bacterium]|nr:tRNA pseudouridine(55) synthase TruB [Bacteroidota bacterium]